MNDHADASWLLSGLTTFMAALGADLATTMHAVGRGTGREVNPLFAPLAQKPLVFGAAKMGMTAGTAYFLWRVHRTHPKLATALSWTLAGTTSAVAIHNMRVARR